MSENDRGRSTEDLLKESSPGPGMLRLEEYRERRSENLLNNPQASLDEQTEIKKYFATQNPDYLQTIQRLARLDHPMKSNCRVVITIPAYHEGSRIRHSLEQFAKQNIDSRLFEIVIFETPVEGDNTSSKIDQFRKENPHMSIILASKSWDEYEPHTVGNGRKYAADSSLARIAQRGERDKDTILLFIDADTVFIPEDFLTKIVHHLDMNPLEDAVTTSLALPENAMQKPNVAAAFLLLSTFEELYATGDVCDEIEIPEPALTNGRSTAVRAKAYAGIGGFNPRAVISEDWEFGWMLADARDWDASRISYFNQTFLTTDPRRFIDSAINRVPTDQQLMDFESKPEVRQLNNEQALALVSDAFDWELFQDDVDSVWHSQTAGSNARIGKRRFELLFNAVMERLGVTFEINEHGGIKITNVDTLLQNLYGTNNHIEIIHSIPREYPPELILRIRECFSEIPIGVMRSRQLKAEQIVAEIKQAQEVGDFNRISALKNDYERFAGNEYHE